MESAAKLRRAAAVAAMLLSLPSCRASTPVDLALVGGRVYSAPDSPPLDNAVVLIRDGRIVDVAARESTDLPPAATTIDATGLVIVAGFQNSHVHFTPPGWTLAPDAPAAELAERLQGMATRWGFTTVVDTGSDPTTTRALRQRVDSGEIAGPRILSAGIPLYPPDGIPFYVRDTVPSEIIGLLHQPRSAAEAAAIVQAATSSDIVKIFASSIVDSRTVKPMPLDVAGAVTREAHARNRLVFAHASDVAGLDVALTAGVDVLAHALGDTDGFTPAHRELMLQQGISVIPTLKLFEGVLAEGAAHVVDWVKAFATAGGSILFGTDVGFIEEVDPIEEYVLLGRAGLSYTGVLASLTTNPAARFGEAGRRGRLIPGADADIVVLGSDPAANVRAFADVRYTIRGGRIIYQGP